MADFKPNGWHSITLRLVVSDPQRLVQFLRDVFEATGDYDSERPSVVTVGDTKIMVSGIVTAGAVAREPMPAFLYLYVPDTDDTYRRALKLGATSLEAPAIMPYGDRRAMMRDPFGNVWQIATHLKPAQ
jgi:uncharacterized glyoxalase superfamily protein PhnB